MRSLQFKGVLFVGLVLAGLTATTACIYPGGWGRRGGGGGERWEERR
jgi:hypothetical protein